MKKIEKIEDISEKIGEHVFVESFLLSVYDGKFNDNDKMFNRILSLLKKRCDENSIEFNLDSHSKANMILKTLVNEVNKKNNVNISFDEIDRFEDDYIDNINKTITLPTDKKIIQFDSITNVDFMHNPTTSIIELFREYVASKMEALVNDACLLYKDDTLPNNNISDFDPFKEYTIKKELSDETKELFKSELEFYTLLPYFSKIFKAQKKYSKQVKEMRYHLLVNHELEINPEYINQLYNLVNHDKSNITYYYHGADSIKSAIRIMNEGLFMQYGDINRTAKKELTVPEIINYSYGFENVGRHAIVIIGVPHGELVVKNNTNSEIEVVGTGQGIAGIDKFKPPYIIPSEYIVGYIDKDNKNIIYNDNFKKDKIVSHKL